MPKSKLKPSEICPDKLLEDVLDAFSDSKERGALVLIAGKSGCGKSITTEALTKALIANKAFKESNVFSTGYHKPNQEVMVELLKQDECSGKLLVVDEYLNFDFEVLINLLLKKCSIICVVMQPSIETAIKQTIGYNDKASVSQRSIFDRQKCQLLRFLKVVLLNIRYYDKNDNLIYIKHGWLSKHALSGIDFEPNEIYI